MIGKKAVILLWSLIGLLGTLGTLDCKLDGEKNRISRHDFPADFIFGAGTSAYQVEGAAAFDGRKLSIWDAYARAGKMDDGSTGDVAADQYHHYKEDVRLMYEMGLDAYRFSISWSRLIPDGRGAINPKGLEYYNSLINELRHYGIEPHVTLYHFDLPQSLEDAYGGWLSSQIIEDFKAYAEVCFREFGDRVKYWTTFNEPAFTVFGYDWGSWPPQRCSFPFGWGNCTAGNSKVEPYIATHHVLLSHAEAVSVYREKFQEKHKGLIGLALFTAWFERMTNTTKDFVATQRTLIFQFDPIVYGDYHSLIKEMVGSRLPTFSKQQSKKLKASFDFIGVIHYNTFYVSDAYWPPGERDYPRDMLSTVSELRDGIPIAKLAPSGLAIVPWGMQAILEYFKQQYGNPPVIAYENGYATANNESLSLLDALNDQPRVDYLHDYLGSLLSAIRYIAAINLLYTILCMYLYIRKKVNK